MKATILLSLPFLTQSLQIEDIEITAARNVKERFFDDKFITHFGTLLPQNRNCLDNWAVRSIIIDENEEVERAMSRGLVLTLIETSIYLNFLWLARDNCASVHTRLAIMPEANIYYGTEQSCDYMSDGRKSYVGFTIEEMKLVSALYNKYKTIKNYTMVTKEVIDKLIDVGEMRLGRGYVAGLVDRAHYDDFTRIDKALMFLGKARTLEFLPLRISFFMPILEALFSTESEGVNFKVPLRVANYLGGDRKQKKEIFDRIVDAYNVRSRYIHGDNLLPAKKKKSMDYLIPISINIDQIIRQTLVKIIGSDSDKFLLPTEDKKNSKGEIEEYGLRNYLNTLTFN